MFVSKVGVVGAGTMGAQIAQVIAAAQIPVVLKDVDEATAAAGLAEARRVTESQGAKQVQAGRLSEQQAADRTRDVVSLIEACGDYAAFAGVDLVIEAVSESLELKRRVFAELDAATPGHAILATNSSSLSVDRIADATIRPERVCGLHFFSPAAAMPLVEVAVGERTGADTIAAAIAFCLAIRKQPVRCAGVAGLIVNRVLYAGFSEVFRAQEERGLAIGAIDAGLVERGALPVGPFKLQDLVGIDVALSAAEGLQAAHGDRFHVPPRMRELVAAGRLGAKSGGGFYAADGDAGEAGEIPDLGELEELLHLGMLAEAFRVLEQGVASHREIDAAMSAGAGLDPRRGMLPPFRRADADGLDAVAERMAAAARRHGERFAPPVVLRRLVAQGRLGEKSGHGLYPHPRPDPEQPATLVKVQTVGTTHVAWLSNGPLNSISRELVADLQRALDAAERAGARTLVLASSAAVFCAGADIKELQSGGDAAVAAEMNAFTRALERSPVVSIAAVNGLALGGGCELAMACDVRLAARSSMFGQPEIKLGLIPGFGGTQRLPRLIGEGRALELMLTGDPIDAWTAMDAGLVTEVHDDHELYDAALAWGRRAAELAPLAVAEIKRLVTRSLDADLDAERAAFERIAATDDAHEGVAAFLGRRRPSWTGSGR